jgi:hypothetical protein
MMAELVRLPITYIVKSGPTLAEMAAALLGAHDAQPKTVTFVVAGILHERQMIWPDFVLKFSLRTIQAHVRGRLWVIADLVESSPKGLRHIGAFTYAPRNESDGMTEQLFTLSLALPPNMSCIGPMTRYGNSIELLC